MNDKTITFKPINKDSNEEQVLQFVWEALSEKGYDPARQLTGYFLSGDPTYITSYRKARQILAGLDRFAVLEHFFKKHLDK